MTQRSPRLGFESLEDRSLPSATLNVTVENLADDDGLFLTPLWTSVHNGRFDIASLGRRAERTPGLELLAEEGDTSEISEYFQSVSKGTDTTILAPEGFAGAPVFDPGEVVTETIEVDNPRRDRFFSFASMVIPSNDAFIGNLNSRQYRLFNDFGEFRGPVTIEVFGRNIWDSGTEVNNPQGGAAFSTEGGVSENENRRVRWHPGLDNFIGTGLPTGGTLGTAFNRSTPIARITIDLATTDLQGPEAKLDDAQPGDSTIAVRVLFQDDSGVDSSSIDPSDLFVVALTRSGFRFLAPVSVLSEAGEEPGSVVATYQLPAPGSLGPEDSGRYFVYLNPGAVEDSLDNQSRFRFLGSFVVDL